MQTMLHANLPLVTFKIHCTYNDTHLQHFNGVGGFEDIVIFSRIAYIYGNETTMNLVDWEKEDLSRHGRTGQGTFIHTL
jgi:hypothetical protein